ncbi:MAG: hypothetical protein GTO18_18815 [Anaerolineales bacterium]|nr:hypothetical protein [Anaerolineales bacterium]
MFFKGSRYAAVGEHTITDKDGRVIRYKKIRFIQGANTHISHTLAQGERLDHIAHSFYKEPDQFWRICDANVALWPDELLEEVGTGILIPIPGS